MTPQEARAAVNVIGTQLQHEWMTTAKEIAAIPEANKDWKPEPKIQATLSEVAAGLWQAAHDPQPLLDMRPTMGVLLPGAASNSPMEVLYSSRPMCTLSARVPGTGRLADCIVATTASGTVPRSITETLREMWLCT